MNWAQQREFGRLNFPKSQCMSVTALTRRGHVPISCSTCKSCPAWRESNYAQHAGIKRLRSVRRKYVRTTAELLGRFALATSHECDGSGSPHIPNPECVLLCPLPSEPSRRRHASGHQCRPAASHEITLPSDAERYTLTAKQLHETSVQLNGKTLQLNRDGDVPQFLGQSTRAGHISFAPTS